MAVAGAMVAPAGATEIDDNVALVAVRVAEPLMPAADAVIVVVPTLWQRATPLGATVATPVLDELQVTLYPRLRVAPSLNVPIATKDCVVPFAIDGFAGSIAMETKFARFTVRDALL